MSGEAIMKAAMIEQNGGPEVFVYGDLPDPTANPDEVVVDIHAASVNAADWKVRSDEYGGADLSFPYVLGRDFSGVVRTVGEGVDEFSAGDPVFGNILSFKVTILVKLLIPAIAVTFAEL